MDGGERTSAGFVWQLIAATLWAGIARDWEAAARMPADVAMAILDARHELENPPLVEKVRSDQPTWETRSDGSKTMSFGTMDGLRAAIKASGGAGFNGAIKVGQ